MKLLMLAMTGILSLSSVVMAAENQELTLQEIQTVINSALRPEEDKQRDVNRLPSKVMHFSRIAKGDHVLDLFAGGGWYTELFSTAVGNAGTVYAQNDSVIWNFAEKGMTKRTKNNRLPNVKRLDKVEIADMAMPDSSVDIVFTALNYHDLFFTYTNRNGEITKVREQVVDHRVALANIKQKMKDDGVFIIIDHHGQTGSGYDAPNELHRIDANIVKHQMAEAGFTLVEEAYYLVNPKDDPASHVFAKDVRGKSSRFIYKYQKMQ